MGAGSYGAGVGPAGHDLATSASGSPILRGHGAIWYDGAARDYLLDAQGNYRTVHFVDQKVALALVIREGDVAGVPTLGSRLALLKRGSRTRLQAAAEDAVRLALAQMLADGEVELGRVDVASPARGKLLVTVYYKNLLLIDETQRQVRSVEIAA
jgi:hypothetical protein